MSRVYGLAELIVAKQRHGATGKVRLKFDSRITKFSDAADDDYLPEMRTLGRGAACRGGQAAIIQSSSMLGSRRPSSIAARAASASLLVTG